MFCERKFHKVDLNSTNSYLVEMIRAILKRELKTDVILTQIRIVSNPETYVAPEIRKICRGARSQKRVEIEAMFTSLDFPRRCRYEGACPIPILAKADFGFVLADVTIGGWYNWMVMVVEATFKNFYDPKPEGEIHWEFSDTPVYCESAPAELVQLSYELSNRRPIGFQAEE